MPKIPFDACTATASLEKLKKIHQGMGLHASAISILEPTNRPNLFYGVRSIEGNGLGQKDLEFLIPKVQVGETLETSLIPKTLVYIDHKQDAPKIADEIRLLLPSDLRTRPPRPMVWNGDPRSQAEIIVCVYHVEMSSTMKNMVIEDWKAGKSRIMIASSACGLSINDKEVERIIQWGVKRLDNLDTLKQRYGHCARDSGKQGLCLLFTEKNYIGPRALRPINNDGDIRRSTLED